MTAMIAGKIEHYTAAGGRRLALRTWTPPETPKARVVFLHGVISHGGWYGECASQLAASGLGVSYLDRRGSGLNANEPGDVDSWQTWIDDVSIYLEGLRANSADRSPVVLCGISWGGKLAAAVARRHPGLVSGLVLICPGLYSPFSPGIAKRLALKMPVPARVEHRRVRIPLRRSQLFTDNAAWQRFVDEDPLTLRTITWRFAREDCKLTRYAHEAAPYLHMPLLLMLAGRDRIVNNRRIVRYFRLTSPAKRTLIEYPHAHHTLEFEINPTVYFADLVDWLGRLAT